MLCYHEPNAKVFFDSDVPAVRVEWKGEITHELLSRVLGEALPLFKAKKTEYPNLHWISDVRGVSRLPKSADWKQSVWYASAIEAGLTDMAFIKPFDIFVTLSVNRFMDLGGGYKNRFFDSLDEARLWIKTLQAA